MSSKTLCMWLRIASMTVAAVAFAFCAFLLPQQGIEMTLSSPEITSWYWPWLIFIWAAALPCFAILVFVWKVAGAIKRESVFTTQTAKWINTGARLLFGDVAFFFLGNLVLLVIGINHPAIVVFSTIICIFAFALALLAAVLSRYIGKAAVLQEESESTI